MQKLIILTSFSLLLGACSWLKLPDVYTVPRYQGNIIEQKMVDQLVPGLSREQVVFIMGTPLIQDSFYTDRWDYVYTTQVLQQDMTEERITLFFKDDTLVGLEGDFKPDPVADSVGVDDSAPEDENAIKEVTTNRMPAAQIQGEDTTLYTGGSVNAIKPEGDVTETVVTPDPYKGLTPDGRLATPTPTPAAQ